MVVLKCKMCGGDLPSSESASTLTCEYCGITQTIPKGDDEKKLIQFERAERLRRQCEFDKAAGIYESIVADFRQEAEAYWGLVLCKYGIEYVDDPATGKKIPTCHRSSFDSIMEDEDFEQALENADSVARKVYREEAKTIEDVCTLLGSQPEKSCKAVVYQRNEDDSFVLIFTRGDMEINETKLTNYLKAAVHPAVDIENANLCAGNIGPVELSTKATVLFDRSLVGATNLV